MAKRIRLSRAKGWRLPQNAKKVSRPGPWGNPFKVGEDGTAEECVEKYRMMIGGYLCLTSKVSATLQRESRDFILANLDELKGKDLACWCQLDKPCHADVLLKLANAEKGD